MTAPRLKTPSHEKVNEELGEALTGLFTVVRRGYENAFASVQVQKQEARENVKRTKHSIDRGAGVEGEPFRI